MIDLDLEKFFDRVNHDKLMAQIAKRVEDKRLLRLIRAFLNAGVMENGLVSPSVEGTPQGGPLSPLLSNVVLDELDRELERRGHRFVRYADDANIYVRSERAGLRVMESIKLCLSGCHPQPLAWTFTSVAIFGSHNRSQSSSDFFPTTRPAPPTWRRLAGATGLFAPIVRRRESRSASQIVLASCAAASAAVTPD